MAEAGMGTIGQGDMPAFLPEVFPFAVGDEWGICLAVFTLESLAALCCAAWLMMSGKKNSVKESSFIKACAVLCSVQIFLEMLITNYWVPFMISFIHMEQVLCGIVILILIVRGAIKIRKAGPVFITILLMGLNALMQFVQDKPYYFPILENVEIGTLAALVYAMTGFGLALVSIWTISKVQSRLSKGI
jgi:hypothetical protein